MPVSSYVIKAASNQMDAVSKALKSIDGLECGEIEDSCIPAAYFAESESESKRVGELIEAVPGVIQASLVYHNFEDVSYQEPSSTALSEK